MRESLRFHLQRDEDETGISGTGVVAYGVQFPDGTCVLRWDTAVNSTTFYASINDVEYLHGHAGRTRIVWDDVQHSGLSPLERARRFVESLMVGVYERGKMAGWVAPPATGVHAKPVDFDYVQV